ncbi:MAG TPA: acyl-ACP--UDP-N-acetylglucosamine O-acyltransferase [Chitinophagaceae bacterium]|nr:acyl-ACP--UDP-N-acetylglucosamine O-acyltransferase [Chitinophagaceae bacterium]
MISPLAQIHPKAQIGTNVTIEAFSVVYEDVEIGDNTHIMPNVTIFNGSRIGKNCRIFPGAVIGAIPQDLKYAGEKTTAVIGDNTTIRECVTVNLGTQDRWTTKVGSNCLLMAYVHIAHDCIIGNNVIIGNASQLAGHVLLDDFAIVGGLCGIQQFIHIGAHTYVAGQLLIRKDIPPFVKAARDPLTFVGVNKVGLERRGFSKEVIKEIDNIYHIIFVQGHSTVKALEMIERSVPDSDIRKQVVDFIRSSRTGIIKKSKDSIDENMAV